MLRASAWRCASVVHGGTPTQPTHNISVTSSTTSVHKSCGAVVCRPLCGVVGLGPFFGTRGLAPLCGVEVSGPSAPLCGVVGLGPFSGTRGLAPLHGVEVAGPLNVYWFSPCFVNDMPPRQTRSKKKKADVLCSHLPGVRRRRQYCGNYAGNFASYTAARSGGENL